MINLDEPMVYGEPLNEDYYIRRAVELDTVFKGSLKTETIPCHPSYYSDTIVVRLCLFINNEKDRVVFEDTREFFLYKHNYYRVAKIRPGEVMLELAYTYWGVWLSPPSPRYIV